MRNGLLAILVMGLAACGGGGGDNAFIGGNGGGSTGVIDSTFEARISALNVAVGNDELEADGARQTFIDAQVQDQAGSPMADVTVSFDTTSGILSSSSATTGADGNARVFLTSSQTAGKATVSVTVEGIVKQVEVTFSPGDPVAANSNISANPASIPADGSSATTVSVVLADANGNLVADGTSIRLVATNGTVVGGDTVASDLGRAEFALQAPAASGTAELTVQADGSAVDGLSASVSFGTASAGEPVAIELSPAVPDRIFVKEVGKGSQSDISFVVRDSAGDPIIEAGYGDADLENVRVTFITRPNGGERVNGTNSDGDEVSSDAGASIAVRTDNGSHTVSVLSGTLPGVIELRVEVLKFSGADFDNPDDVAVTASLPQLVIASGPPETLVLTSPNLNAIVDETLGVYSRRGKVLVTDKYGNVVPDGTAISLGYVDSVLAHSDNANLSAGNLEATSSLISLRCDSPVSCAADTFDFNSEITRNNTARGLQTNDRVLVDDAIAANKNRVLTSIQDANNISVQADYVGTETNLYMVAGASLSGGSIGGVDENGQLTPGAAKTIDGTAEFRITYPADVNTILNGCYGYLGATGPYSTDDKRWEVPQSAQTWVVAVSNETPATVIDGGRFCFAAVAGGTLTATPASIRGGSGDFNIGLSLVDGGDQVSLPFVPLSFTVEVLELQSNSQFSVSVDIDESPENNAEQTNINGDSSAVISINGPACDGDAAEVTFYGGDATVVVSVEVTVNEVANCGA